MPQYRLQPYSTPSSRFRCPECNHSIKSFVRYINIATGETLADHVGRCGRADHCGYHYKPGEYFKANPVNRDAKPKTRSFLKPVHRQKPKVIAQPKPEAEYYIHPLTVNASFTRYERNNFVQYLITRFGLDAADGMVGRYRIGTSKYWRGATVFWQLDSNGLVRTGKIMLYNAETGKRVKEPFNYITWAHTALLKSAVGGKKSENNGDHSSDLRPLTSDFRLRQCLFGEHLLGTDKDKHVAIVESEKTAIIASHHDPQRIWLAAGSISNLNPEICQILQNRRVTLYPDLNAYTKWKAMARQLQTFVKGSVFTVSDLLEQLATDADRVNGLDLGDYL
jgi:hypothetical protein